MIRFLPILFEKLIKIQLQQTIDQKMYLLTYPAPHPEANNSW